MREKAMKKNLVKALMLVVLAGFVACNDDDPAPQGVGDAYVISKMAIVDDETQQEAVVYGLRIEAAGYYGTLSSVQVKEGSNTYTLEKDTESGAFYYETEDYSITPPNDGTYTFTFNFATGEIYTGAEALSDDVLLPADITLAEYTNDKIELEWEEVDDADAIYIQLKEADGDLVFRSLSNSYSYLEGDETEYTITQSTGSWESGYTMNDGATYTVEVIALLADGTGALQAVSTGATTVVWGVE